ncbi:uncharacterized protein LOC125238557 [Leguminivora glycinivorella]|uniref:uncharacterized protein LOC125238557 n=1 Tax=Leguminivora glycinivorella TaxID=1035111 RepID=UPI00200F159C|nr:uncharacterized protein LOC125238557 [Leguminivora glycinivorella]
METDRLMQAVLQSFLDADLRVEVVPKKYQEEKYQGRTADVGTGPSYDATTQAAGRNVNIVNYTKPPEPSRVRNYSGRTNQCDSTTQAVDGQYATVYRVQHCKMTPTSPPPMTSEFPPQRPDVAYGELPASHSVPNRLAEVTTAIEKHANHQSDYGYRKTREPRT